MLPRILDLRRTLPVLTFALLALGITAAAAAQLRGFRRDLRAQVERELASVADLKTGQIVEWRQELLEDAAALQHLSRLEPLVRILDGTSDETSRMELLHRLQVRKRRQRLTGGALLAENGAVLLTTTPRPSASGEELAAIGEALRSGATTLVDLPADPGAIRVIVPIARDPGRRGAVLFWGQLRDAMPESIRRWPTPAASAEAFLAAVHGNEAVVLDALRYTGGEPFPSRFRLAGAHPSERGGEGVSWVRDHRGLAVIATQRRIPGSRWVLSAKVNEAELLAPVAERERSLTLATAAVLAACGAALFSWLRAQRAHLRRRELDIEERERLEHLQYMWKHAHDAVVIAAASSGEIVEANDRALALYGFTRAELLGLELSQLRAPEEQACVAGILSRLRAEPRGILVEMLHRHKDGACFPVEVGLRLIDSCQREFVYCIARDITERREAEARQRAMEAQLAFSDRLASIGTLAAGVAHEINNPLSYVISNLAFAGDSLRERGTGAEHPARALEPALQDALDGARRISEIVRTLRTLSRRDRDPGEPPPIDLREPVVAAVRMAGSQVKARAQLVLELGEVPLVAAPEHELAQVALNLLVNAAHAIPDRDGQQHRVRVVTRTAGSSAVLEVMDTGRGIAPEHLPHLFDPFFTTKPVGHGTGLGLSICHGIVERLGGRIEVVGAAGRGSTFRVLLPAAGIERAPTPQRRREIGPPRVDPVRLAEAGRDEVGLGDPAWVV